MNLDLEMLDLAVEKAIRPFLIDQGNLKDVKSEGYVRATVLPKAKTALQRDAIEKNAAKSIQLAIDASANLLSQFEKQYAINFVKSVNQDELRDHLIDLLFGIDGLNDRILNFAHWSKVKDIEGGKKSGIQLTVIGYLLGFSNPESFAFCKPNIYKAACTALLPDQSIPLKDAERLVHTAEFYSSALGLFKNRYQLPFTDLLDVHTAFYIMKSPVPGMPGWDELIKPIHPLQVHHDLNVILFGPPGTGKTYDTIRRAVDICDEHVSSDRAATTARYQQLRKDNRIGFVTFHQSYGYEDFIEGIRPVLEEGDRSESVDSSSDDRKSMSGIQYECRAGILKTMCTLAGIRSVKQAHHEEIDLSNAKIWKMSLGDTQIADEAAIYDECIENNYILLGYGRGLDFSGCKSKNDIIEKLKTDDPEILPTDYHVQSINAFQQQMAVGDLVVVSDGLLKFRAIARVTGPYRFLADRSSYQQMRPVEWLVVFDESLPRETINEKKNFSQMTLYRLRKQDLKLSALKELIVSKPKGPRNHVLIIDEINRGNIAKILGELITLLEPDKRLKAENELKVTLPYSGEEFGVPSNLYIIGTMNTADRSIAFLDVALRRRFQFIEMMPDPGLIRTLSETNGVIDGINVPLVLQTINDRIELLYDRDHQIGHSFFLRVTSLTELSQVFLGKVIPLLQEYFYGDWSKVCLILGCPFDESGKTSNKNAFPIVSTRLLSPGKLFGSFSDLIEEKVCCEINRKFASPSSAAELRPFFEGLLGTVEAN